MAFNPLEFKVPGENMYEGVLYGDMFFTPPTRDKVKGFKGQPSDLMIASYPKTGLTLATAMLTQILNDGDATKADAQGNVLFGRLEYLERMCEDGIPAAAKLQDQAAPRMYKTHLRYKYVQPLIEDDKVKTIVLLRNPKDTLVSYYFFNKMCKVFGNFPGSFRDYFEVYKANRLILGDHFEWYRDWWVQRKRDNVLVLKYEDMVGNPVGSTRAMAEFVGKDLQDDTLQKVADACGFTKMKENPACSMDNIPHFDQSISNFYRKGKVGDWKNHFNEEESNMFDAKCKEYFEPVGLNFDYE